jgi:hypothetical protein
MAVMRSIRTTVAIGVTLATILAGSVGCRGIQRQRPIELGPADTGPGSVQDARRQLEGRWELRSAQVRNAQGQLVRADARGSLTYDSFGNFQSTGEVLDAPAGADPRAALNREGRAVINPADGTLWVRADDTEESIAIPPQIPRDQVMRYEITGDQLTLTTEDASGSTVVVLSFERVP